MIKYLVVIESLKTMGHIELKLTFFWQVTLSDIIRGLILRVTWPALGSNDLNLDQSGTSIQILPEPNVVHETRFFVELRLYYFDKKAARIKLFDRNDLALEIFLQN